MQAYELRVPIQTRVCELRVSISEQGPGLEQTRASAVTNSHEFGQLHPIFYPHNEE